MNCLTESIEEKWIPVRDGEHAENGDNDCPCCQAHFACKGCPIKEYTGFHFCMDTPYHDFIRLQDMFLNDDVYELHAECTAAAQREIDFLNKVKENISQI